MNRLALFKNKKYTYPWREKNHFNLLVGNENYFPRILSLVNSATEAVIIEQYLVESGDMTSRIIDALISAANRRVSIYLLFDQYGSLSLNKSDRKKLNHTYIHIVYYNPLSLFKWYKNLCRDHRKFICIDWKTGFTGGAGFTDQFLSTHDNTGWHDIMIEISGEILHDWLYSFNKNWQLYSSNHISLPYQAYINPQNEMMQGHLIISEAPGNQEISRAVINQVKHAHELVWLATPYFVATRKLRRELKKAASRGVDVRLLLPSDNSDHPWVTHAFRSYYKKLLHSGVRIFEFHPTFLHAKILVCDQWCTAGSSNLDRWNRRWSLDANLEIDNKIFSQQARDFFTDGFRNSNEISLEAWQQRGWLQYVRETFSQKIVYLLEIVGKNFRQ